MKMNKYLWILLLLSLGLSLGIAQPTPSTSPSTYYSQSQLAVDIAGLPAIRGTWYFVDPTTGSATNSGKLKSAAFATLKTAYDACTSGAGDGICVVARGTGTASQTTSYLKAPLAWSKYSITVYGLADEAYFGRARITTTVPVTTGATVTMTAHTVVRTLGSFITDNWAVGSTGYCTSSGTASTNNAATFTVTAVTALTLTFTETFTAQTAAECGTVVLTGYFAPLITISGENNRFFNLHIVNGSTLVQGIGGVSVQANRNYFKNCHFIGASNATAAAVATTQFDIEAAASELQFDDCYFGTKSTIYAAANAHIKLGISTTQIGQVFFNRCKVISYSATAGHGAIIVTNAVTLGGWITFSDCTFSNWNSGAITALTTVIIGATPNNCGIFLHNCGEIGWAAWGANDDKWVTDNAAGAAGVGGIGLNIQ